MYSYKNSSSIGVLATGQRWGLNGIVWSTLSYGSDCSHKRGNPYDKLPFIHSAHIYTSVKLENLNLLTLYKKELIIYKTDIKILN